MLEVIYSTLLTLKMPEILTFERIAVPDTFKSPVTSGALLGVALFIPMLGPTEYNVDNPVELLKVDDP